LGEEECGKKISEARKNPKETRLLRKESFNHAVNFTVAVLN
jgi:hypothetical protein